MRFKAFATYASKTGLTTKVIPETQNSDYESGIVEIGGDLWHIRTARNTPTKPGAFVVFWQRDAEGNTKPFSANDSSAGLLVFVEQDERRGVFRFTRAHLAGLGITSGKRSGKRGFRVYPSWCSGLNSQAAATQRSQASAFEEF